MRFALVTALALLAAPLVAAQAQDNGLTLYGGWRFGGSFQQDDPNAPASSNPPPQVPVQLRDGSAFSVALDLGLDAKRQFQILLSRHNTGLRLAQGGTLPLRVVTLHVGGTNFFDESDTRLGQIGRGLYVVGGLGLSQMSPGLDGYLSETRPSMNVGLGWMQPLGNHLALRFEMRGYLTLLKGSGSLFCSGGCTLKISGDSLTQGEVMVGLTTRF